MATIGGGGKEKEKIKKLKKKRAPDNILSTVEPSVAAEAEEADQEQCAFNTKKKNRIKENNFLYHSIKILQDSYMR